jgi:UDP-3-O-[3-hydroxymyristoyl] N-acetylglucosamine deacetylase
MSTPLRQTTVARPVEKDGIGLHSGEKCAATLLPAGPDAGIVFVLDDGRGVLATAEHVVDTTRGTTLGVGKARVGCVEHLMAALYGMGVDNVRVEVSGSEVPACDGSAAEWVELLRRVGRKRLDCERTALSLRRAVWVVDGSGWAVAAPASSGLSLSVGVDFEGTAAGKQTLWTRLTRESFARELAPARTFALAEEVERLRAAGLGLGGSEENAFAVGAEGYSGKLRFPDEVVRHKALDLVGDLALCGRRLEGQVTAVRPSHRLSVLLAGALRAALADEEAGRREARSD